VAKTEGGGAAAAGIPNVDTGAAELGGAVDEAAAPVAPPKTPTSPLALALRGGGKGAVDDNPRALLESSEAVNLAEAVDGCALLTGDGAAQPNAALKELTVLLKACMFVPPVLTFRSTPITAGSAFDVKEDGGAAAGAEDENGGGAGVLPSTDPRMSGRRSLPRLWLDVPKDKTGAPDEAGERGEEALLRAL
jgi:hypothetical protein